VWPRTRYSRQNPLAQIRRSAAYPLDGSHVVAIRNAEYSDLVRVAEIHVASWQAAYRGLISDEILGSLSVEDRLQTWKEWSVIPGAELWVAILEGLPVGFCRLAGEDPLDDADGYDEITHLYLDPGIYGRGIGYPLFQHAIQASNRRESKGVFLWVLEENVSARRFYERAKMSLDGGRQSRPAWLGDGVYEVRYRCSFEAAV
jgi:ribosomal protein S18 acetylase RimI-like enzyme